MSEVIQLVASGKWQAGVAAHRYPLTSYLLLAASFLLAHFLHLFRYQNA